MRLERKHHEFTMMHARPKLRMDGELVITT
jgi:hypothetical protein